MTRLRSSAVAAAAVAAALALAGCGGGKTAAPPATPATPAATTAPSAQTATPVDATACLPVPASLDRAILSHVVLTNARFVKTRAAVAVATPGYYYVSSVVAGDGAKHLLATWVTRDLNGKDAIYSVDSNAALISQYGASTGVAVELSVAAPGSFRSRRCVAGSSATPGSPAPASGGGAPAGK